MTTSFNTNRHAKDALWIALFLFIAEDAFRATTQLNNPKSHASQGVIVVESLMGMMLSCVFFGAMLMIAYGRMQDPDGFKRGGYLLVGGISALIALLIGLIVMK